MTGGGLVQAPGERGRQLLTALFESEDERYTWLNGAIGVAEGVIEFGTLRMLIQLHRCVHELT